MARLPRQEKGDLVGPTKRGKGTKLLLLVDGAGLLLAIDVDSASPAEVMLIEPLLVRTGVTILPPRYVLGKRYARASTDA